ncbi:MAG: lyase family protein [Chloroflexota bacterium]
MSKLWGGRFTGAIDALVFQYQASIGFGGRLYDEDITASIAWAEALAAIDVLTTDEAEAVVNGLEQVRAEFTAGTFTIQTSDEDIHSAVERRLIELIRPHWRAKLHMPDAVATIR